MAIITVANPKGGVGKTSTAFNIACKLQQLGLPRIVIDLDNLESISELNATRNANKYPAFNIYIPKNYQELYSFCIENSKTANILIDVGGYDASMSRVSVALADLVITPTMAGVTDQSGIKEFAKILRSINSELQFEKKATVFFNNIRIKKLDKMIEVIQDNQDVFTLADTVIKSRDAYNLSMVLGLSVLEIDTKKIQMAKGEMVRAIDTILLGCEFIQ